MKEMNINLIKIDFKFKLNNKYLEFIIKLIYNINILINNLNIYNNIDFIINNLIIFLENFNEFVKK